MKKTILVLALLVATVVSAQKVRYGAKAGINVSTLSGDFFDQYDSRIGFAAGFFATIPFDKTWSFQPEVIYSGQGINTTTSEDFTDQREELDYIQVPLLVRADFGKLYVHLGPQVGVGIWNSFTNEVYKNFDYSALGGLGLNITPALFIEGRYGLGLRNIIEDGYQVEGKNRYFQFMVGYRL